jgi:hypothetical protein
MAPSGPSRSPKDARDWTPVPPRSHCDRPAPGGPEANRHEGDQYPLTDVGCLKLAQELIGKPKKRLGRPHNTILERLATEARMESV